MQFMDENSNSSVNGAQSGVRPLPTPPLDSQLSPVNQLSFPNYPPQVPVATRRLVDYTPPPTSTRQLPEVQTEALLPLRNTTTALRQPVVIHGTGKKSSGTMRPPQGRRLVIHAAVTVLLLFIVLLTLIAVIPTGSEGKSAFSLLHPFTDFVQSSSSNTGLIPQQAATATALTQVAYAQGGTQTYAGLPTAPPGIGCGLNRFFFGQCTYWANMRYH